MRLPDGIATNRFARLNFYPKGWESTVSSFLELFHRYSYIYKPIASGVWSSANEKWYLNDSEILKAVAGVHTKFIGTRASKKSRFAVLDIDANSKYHSEAQLRRLLKVLNDAGLTRHSLYRSSFSEGWHLYIFFEEPVFSADLRRQIVALLSLNGYQIAKGMLEVFPNPGQGTAGMGLRLPLQEGFAWLDKKTLEVDIERYEISATKALELFMDVVESDANSFDDFRQLKRRVQELEAAKQSVDKALKTISDNVLPLLRSNKIISASEFSILVHSIFGVLPPGMEPEVWCRGRDFHLQGLSGPSQRAEAIFSLGHYFFYGDPSRNLQSLGYGCENEREWAILQFLQARHNQQSREINRGRADAFSQVQRAAHWKPAHKKFIDKPKYSNVRPISWIRENANRKSNARKRIGEALDVLKKQKRTFTTVQLQQIAECSRTTLYKHKDIWRKDYEDLADGFFETCTHEYNVVEGAASPESLPPSTISSQITPPGLLAARRIIYELSMRAQKAVQKKKNNQKELLEVAEKQWISQVAALTSQVPAVLTVEKLKALMFVLSNYLSRAPFEENANSLIPYLREIRYELSSRLTYIRISGVPENSG